MDNTSLTVEYFSNVMHWVIRKETSVSAKLFVIHITSIIRNLLSFNNILNIHQPLNS